MTGNRHCTVCGASTDLFWRNLDDHGEEVEVIPMSKVPTSTSPMAVTEAFSRRISNEAPKVQLVVLVWAHLKRPDARNYSLTRVDVSLAFSNQGPKDQAA